MYVQCGQQSQASPQLALTSLHLWIGSGRNREVGPMHTRHTRCEAHQRMVALLQPPRTDHDIICRKIPPMSITLAICSNQFCLLRIWFGCAKSAKYRAGSIVLSKGFRKVTCKENAFNAGTTPAHVMTDFVGLKYEDRPCETSLQYPKAGQQSRKAAEAQPRLSMQSLFTIMITGITSGFRVHLWQNIFRTLIRSKNHIQNPPGDLKLPGALALSEEKATMITNLVTLFHHLVSLSIGILSDAWLGLLRTMDLSLTILLLGCVVLVVTALPMFLDHGADFGGINRLNAANWNTSRRTFGHHIRIPQRPTSRF
nr:putative peptide transporter ptr2 [Quercus suber]